MTSNDELIEQIALLKQCMGRGSPKTVDQLTKLIITDFSTKPLDKLEMIISARIRDYHAQTLSTMYLEASANEFKLSILKEVLKKIDR